MTNDYRSRIVTADEALSAVRSGQRVYIHNGCAEPTELVKALTRRGPELADVEVLHMATMGIADYILPQYEGHFRHNALFIGGNVRDAIAEGRADYTPIFLSEIECLFETGEMPIDVCLIQVSPPDDHGFCSFGVGIDLTLTAAKVAKCVIAQVNAQMPRTYGDSFIHVSQIDKVVEVSRPLCELKKHPCGPVEEAIGKNIAELVPNGACLQLGIGGIPDAVLANLGNHKDLGIHSEMVSDNIVPLIEAGVVNGQAKNFKPRKIIVGFVLGSKKLFDFVHDNPIFEFHPTCYTNDPFMIARNDNMVAINSAIQVDITGQVCSDSLGQKFYSGFGGQVDFIRGAAHSKGGKPIIAIPSTAKDGQISRISATLTPGAGVVTSRADVHYVATEYGVAYLHGKTVRERAESLISIAHPKFRDELREYSEKMHWSKRASVAVSAR